MVKLVTRLRDIEKWEISSGEAYKLSKLKWKTLVSKEISGSEDMSFGLGELDPGKVHGVHQHPHINEIYYVLEGVARVILGDEEIVADLGTAIYIPKGTKHGIINDSDKPFVILWAINGQIPMENYVRSTTPHTKRSGRPNGDF